ncbi:MAG: pseudouridine synthase [Bacilli bacterium]|nr:pseudouridine synthase [Bacilli bacterium]MEE1370860.1 pseudouridine synthase [Bacilli bacterium]
MKYFVNGNYLLFDYLRNNIDGKSKNNIKSLLKNEVVFVNGKIVTKYNYVLCDGDVVEINKKKANNNINIIYEDNDIIVIDKPSKILTISNKNEKVNTLYRMVSDYLKKEHKKVFIIHRLDFDTSGIIMFAKSQRVQKLYQDNWNDLAKIREYTAIVDGITANKGHIESYLKQTKTLLVYSSKNKDGLFAITDYEKIGGNSKYSMLKILISTGRRNQIRCHMADIGHPILGDYRYKCKINPIDRLCLHANRLEIINPITKELMVFNSNIPKEFNSIIK